MTLTRRDVPKALFGAMLAAPLAAQSMRGALYAYVGCYTTAQRNARGDGIHVYRIDRQTGAWTHVQRVGDLVNPSFLVMAADQRHLYSVHGDETYATAFSVDRATGFLKAVNRGETGGRNGVHQAIAQDGRFMVVANYGSGNVAVLPIRADGALADAMQVVVLPGQPGPHRIEQTSSHPHHVVFDPSGRWVIVPDKGLDRVFVFRFDAATGKLTPSDQGAVTARAGSGPRHAAFHPRLPVAWVVNEIASTITTYAWDGERGSLRPAQILPTLSSNYTRREHCRGDCGIGGRTFRLLFQPRTRQYRNVHIRPKDRPAYFRRLDTVAGPHAAIHRFRSVLHVVLCDQRAVRHGDHLSRGRRDRPAGCHGTAGAKRESGVHRFRDGILIDRLPFSEPGAALDRRAAIFRIAVSGASLCEACRPRAWAKRFPCPRCTGWRNC